MKPDEHSLYLGKLVGNFLALETAVRLFLCEAYKEETKLPSVGQSKMEVTHLTNYDSLSKLIDKYNKYISSTFPQFSVDKTIVEIRDIIAHGRVLTLTGDPPLRIFKFSEPMDDTVDVVCDQTMNEQWFKNHIKTIYTQIMKIVECAKANGFKTFQ